MDILQKASRARAILDDDVFKEAISVVKEYHTGTFLNPGTSPEELIEAHRMVRALALIEEQLSQFVTTGKLFERKTKDRHRG